MRTNLQPLEGMRANFIATFSERSTFKTKWGWQEKIVLENIRDVHSRYLTNHVSISDRPSLDRMRSLKKGDLIVFSARVKEYRRGYHGDDINIRLKRPESFDYMLCDVHDIMKQNYDAPKKRTNTDREFKQLMENKHIILGFA